MTYNYNRSHDDREKRFEELTQKRVKLGEDAKYVVICTRDANDGTFDIGYSSEINYFSSLRTARAWAEHFSDLHDHVAGIFRAPTFIEGVDVR